MVKDVEKLVAKLDVELLGEGTEAGVLDDGHIELAETGHND